MTNLLIGDSPLEYYSRNRMNHLLNDSFIRQTTYRLDHLQTEPPTTGPPTNWTTYKLYKTPANWTIYMNWITYKLDHLRSGPPTDWITYKLNHLQTGPPTDWTTYRLDHLW